MVNANWFFYIVYFFFNSFLKFSNISSTSFFVYVEFSIRYSFALNNNLSSFTCSNSSNFLFLFCNCNACLSSLDIVKIGIASLYSSNIFQLRMGRMNYPGKQLLNDPLIFHIMTSYNHVWISL